MSENDNLEPKDFIIVKVCLVIFSIMVGVMLIGNTYYAVAYKDTPPTETHHEPQQSQTSTW